MAEHHLRERRDTSWQPFDKERLSEPELTVGCIAQQSEFGQKQYSASCEKGKKVKCLIRRTSQE